MSKKKNEEELKKTRNVIGKLDRWSMGNGTKDKVAKMAARIEAENHSDVEKAGWLPVSEDLVERTPEELAKLVEESKNIDNVSAPMKLARLLQKLTGRDVLVSFDKQGKRGMYICAPGAVAAKPNQFVVYFAATSSAEELVKLVAKAAANIKYGERKPAPKGTKAPPKNRFTLNGDDKQLFSINREKWVAMGMSEVVITCKDSEGNETRLKVVMNEEDAQETRNQRAEIEAKIATGRKLAAEAAEADKLEALAKLKAEMEAKQAREMAKIEKKYRKQTGAPLPHKSAQVA